MGINVGNNLFPTKIRDPGNELVQELGRLLTSRTDETRTWDEWNDLRRMQATFSNFFTAKQETRLQHYMFLTRVLCGTVEFLYQLSYTREAFIPKDVFHIRYVI